MSHAGRSARGVHTSLRRDRDSAAPADAAGPDPVRGGGLLFYALDPAVDWLQKKRVPRFIGAALMLALVVTGGAALTYSLQGQALTVVDKLPAGARKLTAMLRKTPGAESGTLEKVQEAAKYSRREENLRDPCLAS